MAGFLLDTSCIVAAVCGWHERHEAALGEIERRLEEGEAMLSAAPCLIESYAVLTRLPPPHRLRAEDALSLIDDNFLRQSKVTSIDGSGYARLLRAAPAGQVRGGRVYDAVVVACAVKARASTILTFNGRHFRALVPDGVTVSVPGGS